MSKTVAGELARRRAELGALDKEAAGPLGVMRRSQIRALRAGIIEELDALEVALRSTKISGTGVLRTYRSSAQ